MLLDYLKYNIPNTRKDRLDKIKNYYSAIELLRNRVNDFKGKNPQVGSFYNSARKANALKHALDYLDEIEDTILVDMLADDTCNIEKELRNVKRDRNTASLCEAMAQRRVAFLDWLIFILSFTLYDNRKTATEVAFESVFISAPAA